MYIECIYDDNTVNYTFLLSIINKVCKFVYLALSLLGTAIRLRYKEAADNLNSHCNLGPLK